MAFKLSPQSQSSSMLILPEMHAFSLVPLEQKSRLHMWGGFSTGTGTGIDGYGNIYKNRSKKSYTASSLCYVQLQSLYNLNTIHLTISHRFKTIARFDYNVNDSQAGYTAASGNISCHTSHEVSGLPPPFANCSRKT